MKRNTITLVIAGLLLLNDLWSPSPAFAEPQQLIFSHVVSANTPKGRMALLFKDIVETKMGDQYEVVIHENASLMSDVAAVDAVANGAIHFAAPALSKFDNYTEKLKVFDLPFLFPDMAAVSRFQESPKGQSLTPRERRIFLYAINLSTAYGNAVALAKSRNDRIEIHNMKDIVLTKLTPKELARWRTIMKPIWAEYESVIGEDVINAALASSGGLAPVK